MGRSRDQVPAGTWGPWPDADSAAFAASFKRHEDLDGHHREQPVQDVRRGRDTSPPSPLPAARRPWTRHRDCHRITKGVNVMPSRRTVLTGAALTVAAGTLGTSTAS